MADRGEASPSLPPLSSTYQSSYLWAPHHLQRLTLTQRHYHGYISHSLATQPPHLNILRRRVQKYGDNRFHVHRDIPEHQDYSLTALKLSDLRPTDQLVDRPMTKDSRVVEKEVCQPFPAEHPYTSHISQFSVFPDTHTSHPHTTARNHTHRNIGTQTPAIHHSAPLYYVAQKAVEKGSRIEQHHQFSRGHVTDHMTQQDGYGQLWDLPRSQRHQRSRTYPAPHVQYPSSHSPKPPHTQEVLSTIHCLVAGTTSYEDHFRLPYPHDGPNKTTSRRMSAIGGQNLCGSRPLYLSFSHSRPYTAESRSKYKGTPAKADKVGDDWEWEEEEEGEWEKGAEIRWVTMKDAATQTEPNDEFPPLGLPHSTNDSQTRTTTDGPKTVEMRPSTTGVEQRECSFSVDEEAFFRPRSSITCRRFSQLYGFSRSDTMKHFHSQFPEPVPDLREYGMQKGKRHTIHGYNSYYFH